VDISQRVTEAYAALERQLARATKKTHLFALRPPAAEDDLDALRGLDLPLSEDVFEVFRVHDGQEASAQGFLPTDDGIVRLCSARELVDDWHDTEDEPSAGALDKTDASGRVRHGLHFRTRLYLSTECALALDFNPGPRGKMGQVIWDSLEPVVVADSLPEFLERWAQLMADGHFVLDVGRTKVRPRWAHEAGARTWFEKPIAGNELLRSVQRETYAKSLAETALRLEEGADLASWRGSDGKTLLHNVFGHISLPDEEQEADAAAQLILLLINAGVDPFAVDDQGRDAMYLFRQLHVKGLEHLVPPVLDDAAFLEALSLGKITETIRRHILEHANQLRAEHFEVAVRAAAQDPECRDSWLTPMLIRQLVDAHVPISDAAIQIAAKHDELGLLAYMANTKQNAKRVLDAIGPFMLVAERHQRLANALVEQAALSADELLFVAANECPDAVAFCLKLGADANAREGGRTALMELWHGASSIGADVDDPYPVVRDAAKALIAAGADVTATTEDGEDAATIAARMRAPKLARYLRRATTRARSSS